MIHQSLQWAAKAMHAKYFGQDPSILFLGVSTDTRELQTGEIFFCLIGGNDGHQYAKQALQRKAVAVVIDESHEDLLVELQKLGPVLVVQDTLKALGDLAHAWREEFQIPVVAITGSNGKTSTKELTAAVLNQKFQTLFTQGNLNNLIGVPKTLFRLSRQDQVAVIEMGMNDFGEIARLTEIARPTIALITNIGEAHLEKLGSIEGVAKAKGELFAGLNTQALALVNEADPRVAKLTTKARRLAYGLPQSYAWGQILPSTPGDFHHLRLAVYLDGKQETISLSLIGSHQLPNVLAALVVGHQLGVDLASAKRGLESFRSFQSRLEVIPLAHGAQLIDDCYNANPSSTKAALQTLSELSQGNSSLAILGEMLELGAHVQMGHREVGFEAARCKISRLIAIGEHAQDILAGAREGGMSEAALSAFSDVASSLLPIREEAEKFKWILVKASRGAHLERIVQHLRN